MCVLQCSGTKVLVPLAANKLAVRCDAFKIFKNGLDGKTNC